MNKIVFALLSASLVCPMSMSAQTDTDKLTYLLGRDSHTRAEARSLARPLSREDAGRLAESLLEKRDGERAVKLRAEWEAKELTDDGYRLRFDYRVYGQKPAEGRSLYISLHGGGKTAAAVNDQQWRNQIGLYRPAEGVYIAPRAAVDDWNMWCQSFMDRFYDRLIEAAVLFMDVNPDKVYLMGYSAGGDGVYRMAPRLADRWAAAAMMAGHPGVVDPVSMRNTPFTLWMGEKDGAYDRNREIVRFGGLLDSLQRADTAGYIHEVHVIEGKGHWMERVDSAAVPWMAQFVRNPYPAKIAWQQDDSPQKTFFWLALPEGAYSDAEGKRVVIERRGNTFDIAENDYDTLYIGLNDDMVDLSKPVTVLYNGRRIFRGRVVRDARAIYASVGRYAKPGMLFSAYLRIDGNAAAVKAVP